MAFVDARSRHSPRADRRACCFCARVIAVTKRGIGRVLAMGRLMRYSLRKTPRSPSPPANVRLPSPGGAGRPQTPTTNLTGGNVVRPVFRNKRRTKRGRKRHERLPVLQVRVRLGHGVRGHQDEKEEIEERDKKANWGESSLLKENCFATMQSENARARVVREQSSESRSETRGGGGVAQEPGGGN